jgi:hypothetical protein
VVKPTCVGDLRDRIAFAVHGGPGVTAGAAVDARRGDAGENLDHVKPEMRRFDRGRGFPSFLSEAADHFFFDCRLSQHRQCRISVVSLRHSIEARTILGASSDQCRHGDQS